MFSAEQKSVLLQVMQVVNTDQSGRKTLRAKISNTEIGRFFHLKENMTKTERTGKNAIGFHLAALQLIG